MNLEFFVFAIERKVYHTLTSRCEELTEQGWTIVSVWLEGQIYHILASRPRVSNER